VTQPRRGLGKGLGALIGDGPARAVVAAQPHGGPQEIPVDRIVPNPHQPRARFDPAALDELRVSIERYGVLVPVLVRPRGDRYELIAGERRWRACAALGRATIPAIVRDHDDRASQEIALVENLQRENLDPLEEAMGYAHLLEEYGLTHDELASRLGKSRSAITNALRLLGLPDEVKALLAAGRLSAGHARALLALPEDRRVATARRIVNEGLSVRAVERMAAPPARESPTRARTLDADERAFERRLQERFGVRVEVRPQRRGATIVFRCASRDDLLRVGDLLLDGE
jgi:ParB family chromosome partitioning protein